MPVFVEFACVGCGQLLTASRSFQPGGIWPKSFRWTCRSCEGGCKYQLFLKQRQICYTVCPCDASWRPLPNAKTFDVALRVEAGEDDCAIGVADPFDLFLQTHAVHLAKIVPALLERVAPIDEELSARLCVGLNVSARSGTLDAATADGFADAGARSGYVRERLAPRCRQLGAVCLAEPRLRQLLLRSGPLRVASLGGGPGESAPAILLARRAICSVEAAVPGPVEVAVLDLYEGWRDCVEGLSAALIDEGLIDDGLPGGIWFATADVTRPIEDDRNAALQGAEPWDLVVFSYVLCETSSACEASGFALLRGMLAGLQPGACCVVLDSSSRLDAAIEAVVSDVGGLVISRPSASRCSRGTLGNSLVIGVDLKVHYESKHPKLTCLEEFSVVNCTDFKRHAVGQEA